MKTKDKIKLEDVILKILEDQIKKRKKKISNREIKKITQDITKKSILKLSEETKKNLDKEIKKRVLEEEKIRNGFENRLYSKWEKAINLYEILGIISLEIAENVKKNISQTKKVMGFKESAIFKIHARALRIYKEIFCLIKSGYVDGANARWRSLYELTVICLFLSKNNENVSERYLRYEPVLALREAEEYKKNYKRLNFRSLGKKVFSDLKKEVRKLENQFGSEFVERGDYCWIPKTILSNRNFAELEKNIKLNKWRPFYKFSCNFVHGGPRGLNSSGMLNWNAQNILLVGPTNYGLTDPMQNSAISLLQITSCLSVLKPNLEVAIFSKIMDLYITTLQNESIKIQKQIEKEEKQK